MINQETRPTLEIYFEGYIPLHTHARTYLESKSYLIR